MHDLYAQRNAIVEANRGLVLFVLGRLGLGAHPDADDLIAAGMLGLVVAAEKFDPSRGYQFSTYAVHVIRQKIIAEIKRADLIRLPENLDGARRRQLRKRLRPVHVEAVADHTGTVRHAGEVVADHREAGAVEDLDRAGAVERALAFLDRRSAEVLRLRFFRGLTFAEVARLVGIGKERVRQIEAKALRRLRERRPELAGLLG